jgi:Holliday junction resolvase
MGKMQRDKGARFEREIVHKFEFHDIPARRVPLSGASWLKGDVIADLPNGESMTFELKKRGDGFKTLYDWLAKEGEALVICADRKKPMVVIDFDDFCDLLKNRKNPNG